MKKLWHFLLVGLFCISTYGLLTAFTQYNTPKSCTVLLKEIANSYKGDCKKGLAHGYGKATGLDTYTGKFKKGLPHGKGIYVWANKDKYDGNWKKGLRHGYGKGTFKIAEKDSTQEGYWEKDVFVGKVKNEKGYRIIQSRSIDRTIVNLLQKEGNQIDLKFMRQGSLNNRVDNLVMINSSGNRLETGSRRGFENVSFPFTARISYQTHSKLNNMKISCIIEFVINKPGHWEVILHN